MKVTSNLKKIKKTPEFGYTVMLSVRLFLYTMHPVWTHPKKSVWSEYGAHDPKSWP